MKPIVRGFPHPNSAVVPAGHASPTAPPVPVVPAVPVVPPRAAAPVHPAVPVVPPRPALPVVPPRPAGLLPPVPGPLPPPPALRSCRRVPVVPPVPGRYRRAGGHCRRARSLPPCRCVPAVPAGPPCRTAAAVPCVPACRRVPPLPVVPADAGRARRARIAVPGGARSFRRSSRRRCRCFRHRRRTPATAGRARWPATKRYERVFYGLPWCLPPRVTGTLSFFRGAHSISPAKELNERFDLCGGIERPTRW